MHANAIDWTGAIVRVARRPDDNVRRLYDQYTRGKVSSQCGGPTGGCVMVAFFRTGTTRTLRVPKHHLEVMYGGRWTPIERDVPAEEQLVPDE